MDEILDIRFFSFDKTTFLLFHACNVFDLSGELRNKLVKEFMNIERIGYYCKSPYSREEEDYFVKSRQFINLNKLYYSICEKIKNPKQIENPNFSVFPLDVVREIMKYLSPKKTRNIKGIFLTVSKDFTTMYLEKATKYRNKKLNKSEKYMENIEEGYYYSQLEKKEKYHDSLFGPRNYI